MTAREWARKALRAAYVIPNDNEEWKQAVDRAERIIQEALDEEREQIAQEMDALGGLTLIGYEAAGYIRGKK